MELQCREIMDIGNKNTSGQASRQASRASSLWKLGQNNMTKKGPFFWSSKRNKKQAHKNRPPQFKILAAAVAGAISFNLKINISIDLPQ